MESTSAIRDLQMTYRPDRGKEEQFTGSGTTLERARKVNGPSHKQSKDTDYGIWK